MLKNIVVEKIRIDMILDLIHYCVRENVPFTVFEDWSSILSTCKSIVAGETSVKVVSAAGAIGNLPN